MCGINGMWSRAGRPLEVDPFVAMRDTMRHRGPDDEGHWRREPAGDVLLGHRRLSIVDLTPAGRNPMPNEDGSVQVVFNGEIYNHLEIRRELEGKGHVFRTDHCDTEVLVHLYEEMGERMVERLVGMFAFAIWDEREERLFLARDRLGIKPLYWTDQGGTFAFASEIKALLPLLPRRELDVTALRHYMTFVAVPPPRTLFAGVSKLAPATTMTIERDGPPKVRRYWDPIANRAEFTGDWEEELKARLSRSVERRMMSDVPVGVFLSGGVDSSTNVAMMSRLVDEPINTFSVGFPEHDEYNEFEYARRIAERYGANHREIVIGPGDLWGFLPEMVHHQDEPIGDPVCFPLYFVSKLAKESGVTVVHVGEGADEIFAGYPTYVTAHRMERRWTRARKLPRPLRCALAALGGPALARDPRRHIHREALARLPQDDARLWWGGAVAFYERGLERVTTPALRADAGDELPRDVVAQIAADADAAGARDELDRLIYQDLRLRLPELLLMRVDKLTMAHSLEARVPFLDHQVVELAMAMPPEQKIDGREGKAVLKRAMKGTLPDDILYRPKQGFAAPTIEWFRGELGDRLSARLKDSPIHELGYLDEQAIGDVLDVHRSGRADRSFQLWNVLNLTEWFDYWIAGTGERHTAEASVRSPG